MSDQRRTGQSDTLRLLVAVALAAALALTVTSGVAAANTPSLDCIGSGGGPIYEPGSGLTVFENHTEGTIDTFYFPDSDTARFNYSSDGVNLSAAGTADVRLENGTGSTTCLANLNGSDNDITVAPDNDPSLIIKSNVSELSFRDPVYSTGDNAVDLAYQNGSSFTLTFNETGLSSGTTVIAEDTGTNSELDSNTVDSLGAITLILPSGTHDVDLHEKSDSGDNNDDGGGGGGGGGGVSQTPTPSTPEGTTVVSESTSTSRTVSGGTTTVGFEESSPVESISFDSDDVEGGATVQTLSSTPESTGDPPGTTVTTNQITVPENARDTSATIRTRVTAEQLAEVDATADELQINRYNDADEEWQSLDTNVAEETESGVVLEAETPGFSIFIVSVADGDAEETETPESDTESTAGETDTDTESSTDDGLPGFGVTVTLAALVGIALFARRRRS